MRNHHVRGISLSVAVILLAYSVSLFTPAMIAANLGRMLANASVGMSVGVEPNPYNTLASDLKKMEDDLDARERRILSLEEELRGRRAMETYLAYGSLALSACLFMLVGVNFYLDSRRTRERQSPYVVSFR